MSKRRKLEDPRVVLRDIPTSILHLIFSEFLSPKEWIRLGQVSSWMNIVIDTCWERLLNADFDEFPSIRGNDFVRLITKCKSLQKISIDCYFLCFESLMNLPLSLTSVKLSSVDKAIQDKRFLEIFKRLKRLIQLKINCLDDFELIDLNADEWREYLQISTLTKLSLGKIICNEFKDFNSQVLNSQNSLENLHLVDCSKNLKIPSQLKAVKIDAHSQSFEILGLNDSTLRNLADDCPNLERIKIIDYNPKKLNDFTSLSMSIVTSHWPHLQSLNLSSFSENGIRSINDIDIMSASFVCKNLKGITLDSFKNMTDASISELVTNCQHLEKVSLAFTYITDDSLTSLSTLSNLKHLTLRGCRKLSERGFCELFESTGQLTHLNISTASGITDMSFSKLCSSCVKLETLIINDADVTDDSIYHLPDLINLKNLVLSNCKGVEASEPFRELAKLKNLKELSLAGNKLLLNEDLSFVIGVIGKSLMKLRLDGCVLLDIHFLQILCTNSPMMRWLYLKGVKVTKICIDLMKQMKSLKYLEISSLHNFHPSSDLDFMIIINT